MISTGIAYKLSDIPIETGNYFNYVSDTATIQNFDTYPWLAGYLLGISTWFWLPATLLCIVAMWVVFQKANQLGWAILIPFYSTLVYLRIVGRPWWWILLLLIPGINLIISIIITHDLAKVFKHDIWFTVGLIFLPWIFMPILAFGKDVYVNPSRIN